MKTIKLSDSQYKLLLNICKSYAEELDSLSCNDIYKEDLKDFTDEELIDIVTVVTGKKSLKEERGFWKTAVDEKDFDGTFGDWLRTGSGLFSSFPTWWLYSKIKKKK